MTIDILSKTRDWKSKENYFENLEDNFFISTDISISSQLGINEI